MLLLKLAGAALITASGTALGLYYAGLDSLRAQELLEFKKAFLILASEIEYISTPLPEAMTHIAERTTGNTSSFFACCAEKLSEGSGETAYQLWASAVEARRKCGCLTPEDWDVIEAFGKTLGYLDKPMQLNSIRFTTDYIDGKTASIQGDKSKRMYRSLGVLGGLLLAVVLW